MPDHGSAPDSLPPATPVTPQPGWRREHLEQLADRTLLALRPYATAGHARFDLPGPPSRAGRLSDGLEGFARSFLAAGFRLAGSSSDDHDHAGWYAAGLAAGTDPDGPEPWPTLTDVPQARVEAAAIAIALHESRSWIWDALDDGVRQRIVDWLAPSGTVSYPDNNWRWFCNVTQAFLRSVGAPHDQQRVDDNIATMEEWYLGETGGHGGWYRDGPHGTVDWYNGWVMQLFSLWYCRMSAGQPGIDALQDRYRRRLRDYLERLAGMFGADGAPLFQGRSLIYRYATVGAPWAGAIFDASPLPAGQLRRLCLQAVRFFVERGAFDDHGLLSMGWLGRHEAMRQPYSGPGSPYWSSLGLAGLVLGADHPFWSAPEEPLPVEQSDVAAAVPQPGWLISGTRSDGIVRVINHGVDHGGDHEDPFYNRLAYSTATAPLGDRDHGGPDASGADHESRVADNQVVLVEADGSTSSRIGIEPIMITDGVAASRWDAFSCWSAVRGPIEVRAVRLAGEQPAGRRLVISGYAVPQAPQPGARRLSSEVRILAGEGITGSTVHDQENAFGSRLLINRATFDNLQPGRWYVAAVSLTDRDPDAAVDRAGRGWPQAGQRDDGSLTISWGDGTSTELGPAAG